MEGGSVLPVCGLEDPFHNQSETEEDHRRTRDPGGEAGEGRPGSEDTVGTEPESDVEGAADEDELHAEHPELNRQRPRCRGTGELGKDRQEQQDTFGIEPADGDATADVAACGVGQPLRAARPGDCGESGRRDGRGIPRLRT